MTVILFRFLFLVFLGLILTQDCVAREVQVDGRTSVLGDYLSARHARAMRRLDLADKYYRSLLRKTPENRDFQLGSFVMSLIEGNYDAAFSVGRKLDQGNGSSHLVDLALIVSSIKDEDYATCQSRIEEIEKDTLRGLNILMIPITEAWCSVGRGEIDDALGALNPLLERKGTEVFHALHAAMINEAGGRMEEAGRLYSAALREQRTNSASLLALVGGFLERQGATDEARSLYVKYREDNIGTEALFDDLKRIDEGRPAPKSLSMPADAVAEALFDMASSLNHRRPDDMTMALTRLALYLRPNAINSLTLMAKLLERDKRLEDANEIYKEIPQSTRAAWSARLNIAENLDKMDRTDEAVATLRAMAVEYPTEATPLTSIGDILRRRERFKEAAAAYDEAVFRAEKQQGVPWELHYARGIVYEQSKHWEEAEKSFLLALRQKPDQPFVLNYLGYSWVDRGEHLDKAREMIERAVELRPNDGYIVDSLGWALYKIGDYEGAAKQLERAVELRPQDPIINDHLGDVYWRVKRKREASFQWRRALSLGPPPEIIGSIEHKIDHGLDTPTTKAQKNP